jgi:serine/threonine-protein kinase
MSSGTLIAGKYRILDKLGAGGMGEVYRAEDLSLNRQVAIKVLPAVFATDRERLARFEREAKILASVNHPNIAAIYGVEQADAKRFLVLELVEGETLSERLLKGRLPLDETFEICRQLAEGLESAHEKGIIHRDLKPSNVKITLQGKVKILDFGLARAFHDQISEVDLAKSPTITADMTRPGVILGTAAYMSPEQARGRPIDKRADIWAFGCVMYECLTGRRAFQGDTITETLAAILKGDPDWNALPSDTPPAIRRLLGRCLARDHSCRLSDIHDAGLEIKESGMEPAVGISRRFSSRRSMLWTAAISIGLIVLGALLMQLLTSKRAPTRVPSTVRFAIPDGFTVNRPKEPALDISPDGSRLVSIGERGGKSQLFLRTLDQLEPSPLDDTEYARGPFFSPDGRRIGFFAGGKLKTLAITGGAPTVICEAVDGICGSWGEAGTIVFARYSSGLLSVSAAGGTPGTMTTLNAETGEANHLWPQFLPGGKAVLFTIFPGDITSPDDAQIAVQVMGQLEHRILVRGGSFGRYIATGHLVYIRKGALLAVPFDLKTLQVKGSPMTVLDSIQSSNWTGVGHFAVSETGTLAYAFDGVYRPDYSLVLVDIQGNVRPLLPDRNIRDPAFSRDGRIAVLIMGANDDIWVFNPERQQLARFTFGLGDEACPVWTPDGKHIIYLWRYADLFWKAIEGSGEPEQLLPGEYTRRPRSVSPDGNLLAFSEANPKTGGDIWFLPLKGERKPQPFLVTSFNEGGPKFSPNGRWIAYTSDESGRLEIYLQRIQGTGGKKLVSTDGGNLPIWSHTGSRLFFLNGNKMMAAKVDPESGAPGSIESLFELQNLEPGMGYDVAPDDNSFAMVVKNDQPPATELRIVLNWFEELKRLVPSGKK